MKKKIGLFIAIIVVLIVVTFVHLFDTSILYFNYGNRYFQDTLELPSENNYVLDDGYIPNAQTAAKVGGAVLDNVLAHGPLDFGIVSVEYDDENRMWKVTKYYLFHTSGFVIIEQDTGSILKLLLIK